ncbi:MAG: alpha/beta hydrolase [Pseudomonadota bacterium]
MTWEGRPRSEIGGLACLVAGLSTGSAVVLLHGVGLRAEAWGAQLDAFPRCCIVAPDLPGHGQSAVLQGPSRLGAYTDRIARLIEVLDAPVVLLGHSMGAMIALDLAARRPELCRGVAALNAIFRRPPQAAAAIRARSRALAGALSEGGAVDPSATLARWFGTDLESAPARACGAWLRSAPRAGYSAAYAVFAEEDGPSDRALATLSCPALFLTGAQDPNSTPAMSKAMAALVPDGEAVVVTGAAHMMPMTHPTAVNATLAAFLDRCEAGRAAHRVAQGSSD